MFTGRLHWTRRCAKLWKRGDNGYSSKLRCHACSVPGTLLRTLPALKRLSLVGNRQIIEKYGPRCVLGALSAWENHPGEGDAWSNDAELSLQGCVGLTRWSQGVCCRQRGAEKTSGGLRSTVLERGHGEEANDLWGRWGFINLHCQHSDVACWSVLLLVDWLLSGTKCIQSTQNSECAELSTKAETLALPSKT